MIQDHYNGKLFNVVSCDNRNEIESELKQEPVTIGNTTFKYLEATDFNEFWCRKLIFVGSKGNKLYFFIGQHKGRFYFEYIHWISETRFFIPTMNGQTGRDWNYIPEKGGWDWERTIKHGKKIKA